MFFRLAAADEFRDIGHRTRFRRGADEKNRRTSHGNER